MHVTVRSLLNSYAKALQPCLITESFHFRKQSHIKSSRKVKASDLRDPLLNWTPDNHVMSQEKPLQILNYCKVFLSETVTGPFWICMTRLYFTKQSPPRSIHTNTRSLFTPL